MQATTLRLTRNNSHHLAEIDGAWYLLTDDLRILIPATPTEVVNSHAARATRTLLNAFNEANADRPNPRDTPAATRQPQLDLYALSQSNDVQRTYYVVYRQGPHTTVKARANTLAEAQRYHAQGDRLYRKYTTPTLYYDELRP